MPQKKRTSKLTVPSYTKSGNKGKGISLPKEIFGQKPNEKLLAQAVRVYLANQRQAGAKTKTRGEVRKSTRKIWRQKGTGLARHGARSAPIFVGGGVAHGPKGVENYNLALPKKMRRKALASALSAKLSAGDIVIADLEDVEPKTKKVASILGKLGAWEKATIVHGGSSNLWRAGRNIAGLTLIPAGQLTAYKVLAGGKIILTQKSLEVLEKRIKGEKNEAK